MKRKALLAFTAMVMCTATAGALAACNNKPSGECSHDYQWTETKAATCTVDGSELGTCSKCGDTVTRKIDATGHHYVWSDKTQADCEHPATEEGVCDHEDCGDTQTRDKAGSTALGHDIDWHVVSEATCNGAEQGYEYCKREGCDYQGNTISSGKALGHNYDWTTKSEADCTHDKVETGTCTREGCTTETEGHTTERTIQGTALDHSYPENWTITDPENNQTGTAVKVCGRDEAHKLEVTLPKLTDVSKYKEYKAEGELFEEEDKYYQHYKLTFASAYGDITFTVKREGCPNNEHSEPADWTVTKDPTCEEAGNRVKLCENCHMIIAEEEIPALDHDYGEWTITAPTATANGSATRTCGNDNKHTQRVTLPKLSADNADAYTVTHTAAGTAAFGYDTYTLKEDDTISFKVVDADEGSTWYNAFKDLTNREAFIGGNFDIRYEEKKSDGTVNVTTDSYPYELGEGYTHLTALNADSTIYGGQLWIHKAEDDTVTAMYQGQGSTYKGTLNDAWIPTATKYYDGINYYVMALDLSNRDVYGPEQWLAEILKRAGSYLDVEESVEIEGNTYRFTYHTYFEDYQHHSIIDYSVKVKFVVDDGKLLSLEIKAGAYTYTFTQTLKTDENEYPTDPDDVVSEENTFALYYSTNSGVKNDEITDGEITLDVGLNSPTVYLLLNNLDGTAPDGSITFELFDSEGNKLSSSGSGNYYVSVYSTAKGTILVRIKVVGDYTLKITYKGYTAEYSLHIIKLAPTTSVMKPRVNKYNEISNTFAYADATEADAYVGKPVEFYSRISSNAASYETAYTAEITSDNAANATLVRKEATEDFPDGYYVFTATQAGTYVITIRAGKGTATNTITITVNEIPDIAAILSGEYVGRGASNAAISATFAPASDGATNGTATLVYGNKTATYSYNYNAATGSLETTYASGDGELQACKLCFSYIYGIVLEETDEFDVVNGYGLMKNNTEAVVDALEGLWRHVGADDTSRYIFEFEGDKLTVYAVNAQYKRGEAIEENISYTLRVSALNSDGSYTYEFISFAGSELFNADDLNSLTFADGEITSLELYVNNAKCKPIPYDESVVEADPSEVVQLLAGTEWAVKYSIFTHTVVFTDESHGTLTSVENGSKNPHTLDFTYTLNLTGNAKYSFTFTKVSGSQYADKVLNCASASGVSFALSDGESILELWFNFETAYGGLQQLTLVQTYKVTFVTDKDGVTVPQQSVKDGGKATEPEKPECEGFIFDGWYTDPELTKTFSFSTKITANTTLYAKWIAKPVGAQGTEDDPMTLKPGENSGTATKEDYISNLSLTGKHYEYTAEEDCEITITVNGRTIVRGSKTSFADAKTPMPPECYLQAGYEQYGYYPTGTVTLAKGEKLYVFAAIMAQSGDYSFTVEGLPAVADGSEENPFIAKEGVNSGTTTENDYYTDVIEGNVHYYIYEVTENGTLTIGYTAGTNTVVGATTTSFIDTLGFADGFFAYVEDAESFELTVSKDDTVFILVGCVGGSGAYSFDLTFESTESSVDGSEENPYILQSGENSETAAEEDYYTTLKITGKHYVYTAEEDCEITITISGRTIVRGAKTSFADAKSTAQPAYYAQAGYEDYGIYSYFTVTLEADEKLYIFAGIKAKSGDYSFTVEFSTPEIEDGSEENPYILKSGENSGTSTNEDYYYDLQVAGKHYKYTAEEDCEITFTVIGATIISGSKVDFTDAKNPEDTTYYAEAGLEEDEIYTYFTVSLAKDETVYIYAGIAHNQGGNYSFTVEFSTPEIGDGSEANPYTVKEGVNSGSSTVMNDNAEAYINYYTYTAQTAGTITLSSEDNATTAAISTDSFEAATGCPNGQYLYGSGTCSMKVEANQTVYIIAGSDDEGETYSFNFAFVAD